MIRWFINDQDIRVRCPSPRDEGKALLVNIVLGGLAAVLLFAIVRKLRKTWWIWGSIAAFALAVIAVAIGPVFLQPIFNKVTRLNDPKITVPILRMAHANGIPANDVYQIDASRQTTRMSANVSGVPTIGHFGNSRKKYGMPPM